MTNDLKPIPCGCGGKADSHLGKYAKWFIACDKCGVRTPLCDSRTEAVQAWNRAMRRAKVDILPNTSEEKGEMPFCPHCGDELEWE